MITRYHICRTNLKQIKEFLPDIETNGVYQGYSAGFVVHVNILVGIKAIYHKYSKAPEIVPYMAIGMDSLKN